MIAANFPNLCVCPEPNAAVERSRMVCPVCQKRAAKRFCPALGEKICPICCGKEREVTIDCPWDCPYLIAAHRYEAEHRKPLPAEEFPYRDVEFPPDFVYEHWPVVTVVASAILEFQLHNKELNDSSAHAAIESLAETYRTLGTGIYYERPPNLPVARALYGHLAEALQNFRKKEAERSGLSSALKDSDVFRLLVFLLRICKQEMNGRPRSRAFLEFLRSRFPLPAGAAPKETSRIIMP
jgi:hypothetical protein